MKKLALVVVVFWSLACAAQRLPGDALPLSYKITLTPYLPTATFTGEETIGLRIPRATKTITLNSAEIEFHQATITAAGKTQTAAVSLDAGRQIATLNFVDEIPAGAAELHISFKGVLNDKLRGFYLSQSSTRRYATTQLESTDARRAFPCFDEPIYKATFTMTFIVDEADTVVANGRIISDKPGPGAGKHTLQFSTTAKMSSYLVAMAVGDWKCVEGGTDGIPIRICSVPEKKELLGFALQSTEQIVHFFNRYYGIKYPFEKLDVLAVPDFEAGAMENTGAIFYRESVLLVDEKNASVETYKTVAEILAHEIAHQWFGDLVTMKWWDNVWLNEGFATWATSKPLAAWKPGWKEELDDVEGTAQSLDADSSVNTRQIRAKAETPEEINELFDGIAYGKAAAVLRMVESYMGPEDFRKGVHQYLEKYSYGNATAEDFWNTLGSVSAKPVAKIMASFVEQPGAPVVSIKTQCSAGKTEVELSQQRSFDDSKAFGTSLDQLWTIPVCLNPENGKASCVILEQKKQTFSLPGCYETLNANAAGTGFYRVAYDVPMMRRIPGNSWTAAERVRLLRDTWALVRAGQLPVGHYLSLLERMDQETDRATVESAVKPLPTISNDLTDESDTAALQAWIQKHYGPLVQKIGLKPNAGESDDMKQLRPIMVELLGRYGKSVPVLAEARQLAESYLQDRSAVEPSLAPTVLNLAALSNDEGLYEKYLAAARSARSPEEYLNFLEAAATFSKPELVQKTFDLVLSPEIRSQDSPFLLVRLLGNPLTRVQSWKLIKENWSAVEAKFTFSSGSRVVAGTGWFCDAESRADVQSFFAEHKVASAERTLRQTVGRIDNCMDLRAHQAQNLSAWLADGK